MEAGLGELQGLGDCQGEVSGGDMGTGLWGMGEGSCQRWTNGGGVEREKVRARERARDGRKRTRN